MMGQSETSAQLAVSWEIRQGDALDQLREMPAESAQCCVTSPPYFGLRDYGTSGQIGLEATPDEYVVALVAVFREVRRVLRRDGTLWLNLDDGFSDKQLRGMPWRVALALQADGWWLRCDVIWDKPNTLPEPSAKDRPARNHEYLFLLSRARHYHYDGLVIREESDPAQQAHNERYAKVYDAHTERTVPNGQPGNVNNAGIHSRPGPGGRPKRSVWRISTVPFAGHFATFPPKLIEPCVLAGCPGGGTVLDPFAGSGTTGVVALRHGRSFIGIELNPIYAEMGRRRLRDDAPLLNTVAEVVA